MNDNANVAEFFDIMTSNSFFPSITFPTRFSENNGSLIDNFFCKLSQISMLSTTGILVNQLSDHHPYFISLNTVITRKECSKFIEIHDNSDAVVDKFLLDLQNLNILEKIDTDPYANPNENYDILENIINKAKDENMPKKTVRFNKYKNCKSKWITSGILRSIKYIKMKCTPITSPQYAMIKTNLSTYRNILRTTITLAKQTYYQKLFNKYKKQHQTNLDHY